MLTIHIEYPADWKEYTLIDSGNSMKLERFGTFTVARPDPRAIWKPTVAEWAADATFAGDKWEIKNNPPDPWKISYDNLTFTLRPTSFKHVGVFPEQATNWDWLKKQINGQPMKEPPHPPLALAKVRHVGDQTERLCILLQ